MIEMILEKLREKSTEFNEDVVLVVENDQLVLCTGLASTGAKIFKKESIYRALSTTRCGDRIFIGRFKYQAKVSDSGFVLYFGGEDNIQDHPPRWIASEGLISILLSLVVDDALGMGVKATPLTTTLADQQLITYTMLAAAILTFEAESQVFPIKPDK